MIVRMDRTIRRRLRVLAWITFAALVPIVLSSSRGYRLMSLLHHVRFGSSASLWERLRGGTPAVGALVIRTDPRGASAALDGKIVDQRTPAGIGSVPAGTHRVRIEKSGYRPYEKVIDIAGGLVTDLLHVRLLPQVVTQRILRVGVTDFWISPDERRVLLRAGIRLRLATRSAIAEGVTDATASPAVEKHVSVSVRLPDALDVLWSSDSSAAALIRHGDNRVREVFGLLDTEGGTFQALPPRLLPVGWSSLRGSPVFVALSPERALLGIQGQHTKILASGVLSAAVHPSGVLIQRQLTHAPLLGILNDALVFTPLARPETTQFSELAVSRQGNIAAVSADDSALFILPASGESGWQRVGGSGRGASQSDAGESTNLLTWSPDGDKLAYQLSAFDLWSLNVSEERSALPRMVPVLVVRLSSPVQSIQWFVDSQHLLFLTRDVVEFIEIDPRHRRPTEHLASTNQGATRIAARRDGKELWLTARRDAENVLLQLRLTADE